MVIAYVVALNTSLAVCEERLRSVGGREGGSQVEREGEREGLMNICLCAIVSRINIVSGIFQSLEMALKS